MKEMINYLEKEDPEVAMSVKKASRCFEPFNEDESRYARFTLHNTGCRDKVLDLLKEVRMKVQFMNGDREAGFNTEQNALIAVNAEKYYSSLVAFDNQSWNIRDTHMMETLVRLMNFHGSGAKGIVWEHNTHIGDARATGMSDAGMINTGQLAREGYGRKNVYLAGFSSYEGSVIAGGEWGAPTTVMRVPRAREKSIEAILHKEGKHNRYILFSEAADVRYNKLLDHRAIGVVYDPAWEKYGNYVPSVLSEHYDAFFYFDRTTALHPLSLHPDSHKLAATYPFSL